MSKRFDFRKPMVESPYPPKDINYLWVDVDETSEKKKVLTIKEYDKRTQKWETVLEEPKEVGYVPGVFIETVDGKLVSKEAWNSDTMEANNIYISDGIHKVRMALTWCNDSNCDAICASSNGVTDWGKNTAYDDGQGNLYGYHFARSYRWTSGVTAPKKFNEIIEGISIYDSWDFDGYKATEIIKNFVDTEENEDIKFYPAFHACITYKSPKGESGYLMGISELQFCYNYKDEINACAAICGADAFDYGQDSDEDEEGNEYYYVEVEVDGETYQVKCPDDYPWSSSLRIELYAWLLDTDDYGYLDRNYRGDCRSVRAAFK